MNEEKKRPQGYDPNAFSSSMTRGEIVAALLYFPLHIWLLPQILFLFPQTTLLSDADLNLIVYGFGFLYMLVFAGRFLRRDFDPLCEHLFYCVLQVIICYGMMLAFNMILGMLLNTVASLNDNPNNSAVMDMAGVECGKTAATAIFLAPVVEEVMFRGAVFGTLRKYGRVLAYAASMLLFAVYHVWGYAISDPTYWLYILQYLPVSYLLCRCYERCDSIWGSIFLHMTINAISIRALITLSEYLA